MSEKDDTAEDEKSRPWWMWPLFVLVAIAVILLSLLLFRSCEEQKGALGPDGGDGAVEAAADAAGASEDGATDAAGSADATAGGGADAGADAIAAGDAAEAGADGGKDGGRDGGLASNDDDEEDDGDDGSSGGGPGARGGGKVIVAIGPAATDTGGAKTGPHRRHDQREAIQWRLGTGNEKVARTEQRGHRFDVWLGPGRSFEGVRVEWQDKAGKWHVH